MKDATPGFSAMHAVCRTYTMTSTARMYAMHQAVEHVVRNRIEGDVVECGVWRGGSMMMAALTLKSLNTSRVLHLFDTFAGLPKPLPVDVNAGGTAAINVWKPNSWCVATLDDVQRNMTRTGYTGPIHYHRGLVEDMVPSDSIDKIAVLRLDLDWYAGTLHCLEHLYPKLILGGVLVIDDYGHWQGCRAAVEHYFEQPRFKPMLHRVDETCRVCIKT